MAIMKPKDGGPGKPPKGAPAGAKSGKYEVSPGPMKKEFFDETRPRGSRKISSGASRQGMKIAGAAMLGTAAAAALSSPKVRKGIVKGAKKVGAAIKGAFQKKGEYVSNPNTGKMERAPKVKSAKPMSEKAVRNIYKAK